MFLEQLNRLIKTIKSYLFIAIRTHYNDFSKKHIAFFN